MSQGKGAEIVPIKQRYETIQGLLVTNKAALQQAATRHLDVNRLTRLALTEMHRTPKLLECTPRSIVASVMQASQYGLEIGGVLGRAYLVPFWNKKTRAQECQLIVGYKGMIEMAYRSGLVASIEASAVYENDTFEYQLGLDRMLKHVPWDAIDGGADEPGPFRAAYAIVRLKSGGVFFHVMTRRAIDKIRRSSPAGEGGPWVSNFDEMGIKTVIRHIFKYSPASTETSKVIASEELVDSGASVVDTLDPQLAAGIVTDVAEDEAAEPAPVSALDRIVDQAKQEPRLERRPPKPAPRAPQAEPKIKIKVEREDGRMEAFVPPPDEPPAPFAGPPDREPGSDDD